MKTEKVVSISVSLEEAYRRLTEDDEVDGRTLDQLEPLVRSRMSKGHLDAISSKALRRAIDAERKRHTPKFGDPQIDAFSPDNRKGHVVVNKITRVFGRLDAEGLMVFGRNKKKNVDNVINEYAKFKEFVEAISPAMSDGITDVDHAVEQLGLWGRP